MAPFEDSRFSTFQHIAQPSNLMFLFGDELGLDVDNYILLLEQVLTLLLEFVRDLDKPVLNRLIAQQRWRFGRRQSEGQIVEGKGCCLLCWLERHELYWRCSYWRE